VGLQLDTRRLVHRLRTQHRSEIRFDAVRDGERQACEHTRRATCAGWTLPGRIASMPAMRRWLIAVLLVACSRAVPTLPSQGGPSWTELKSEHFILWTDATAARGRELVRELERRQQVITTVMNQSRAEAKVFVIALGRAEVEHYTGPGFGGFAWDADNPTMQPGMLVNAETQDHVRMVTHELTHLISYGVVKHQPRWLAEGMAGFFETAELDAKATSVKVGRPPNNARLLATSKRPVADLFECKGHCVDNAFYATSWALFAYLVNEHYDKLIAYLQRLDALPSDRHVEAWRATFPDLTFENVDSRLWDWIQHGQLQLLHIKVAMREFPATARALGDADVLAARSLLDLRVKEPVAARSNAEGALVIDRTNVLAQLIKTQVNGTIAPDDARATAAAHPDDWHAWRLVARALPGSPEGNAAQARMCSLAPGGLAECAAQTATTSSETKR
jgi:hypothetical protein